jgi:hypothetical protein
MNLLRLLCALLVGAMAVGHDGCEAGAAERAPKSFASPEAAAQGLVDALKANDRQTTIEILGASAGEWISSGDQVADRAAVVRFIEAYDAKHGFEREGESRAVLVIGGDDYPFPFPLVSVKEGWRFDPEQGREEILNRRIGKNELSTIQTLLAIVDAQRDYVAIDRDGDGLLEYAQKFISSPGKQDGLYWATKADEPMSPLGPLVGQATREGYSRKVAGEPAPFHGYHYRMLTAQGKDAIGGAYDYLVRNNTAMIGGFAVLAYPAKYGASGIKSFLVNHQGVVFEKDLGPDTDKVVEQITTFNPNRTWQKN